MATYPIKMMIDESGQPFVPLTSLDAVIGEKNLQYIIDATEASAGHFNIIIKDVTLDKLKNTVVVVRWPQISSTVKPSYLQLNEEEEIVLYNGSGTEYLDLEDASNTVNILAYDGEKWILTSGAGSGSGHIITDENGNTMEQQKVLNFVGFNVENDAGIRATKIINPAPINNLITDESGLGSLDAYQGYILSSRSIPAGGNAGQVLSKKNGSDYQVEWIDRDGDDVIKSDGSILKIVSLTYEEYQALKDQGQIDANTQYHITDVADGTASIMTSAQIQEMIDASIENLSTVAISGSYTDLSDKPTIPSVVNNLTSTSTTSALSANQGKTLQTYIDGIRLTYDQVTGLSLGPSTTYQLTWPSKGHVCFIEPLVWSSGSEYSGGQFVVPGSAYTYITNNDTDGTYRGIWVYCESNGLVRISDYRHCGATIKGFRIWYTKY